ncbi:MAG: hypothetical protein R3293_07630 [Candidatus Promineifilaceae bacterium]|nr:hypothetical protein [Candidatus Promineifilaceae bacterium]
MAKIHVGSFIKSGTMAAVLAGFIYLLALTPFFNNLLLVILLASAILIPFGSGMYYSYLAPGEERMSQSVIGGALSGLVAGLILGIAFGVNAFMIGVASTGILGYAVAGSIGVTILSAAILGVFGAIMGAVGGILWQLVHRPSPETMESAEN